MKKRIVVAALLGMVLVLSGCQKEETKKDILPISQEKFVYEGTEGIQRIAVNKEGILYTVESVLPKYEGPTLASDAEILYAEHTVCVYDTDGKCTKKIEFELGSSTVSVLKEHDGKLYFTLSCPTQNVSSMKLFRMDIATEEVEELAELTGYQSVSDIAWVGDYIYLLGRYRDAEQEEYTLHPDVYSYRYNKETICRFCPEKEGAKAEIMKVKFPIDLYETAKDTLVIYCYTEENGFVFLEFDPAEGTLVEAGQKPTNIQIDILSACEDGYLYGNDKLYYGMVDGSYAQVSPDDFTEMGDALYVKGFVYYIHDVVERIFIGDTIRENVTIQVLLPAETPAEPYGCGFRMASTVLPAQQFSLKVLAQDTDFDLYLLSTRDRCSYNLKENGAFYALNEVEGVQEYLDACFPYVKELAYNEDGDIWMLPIELAIPALVYNPEYCKENGVDFSSMDYMEFLSFTEETEKEDSQKTSFSFFVAAEEMFARYLELYEGFDTDTFRAYAEKLRGIYQSQGEWFFDFVVNNELYEGRIPEVYYEYNIYADTLTRYSKWLGTSDAIGLAAVPKISEQNGNIGTMTFLAVNPQSENLNAVLDYVSAYAKYMVTKKDSFLLTEKSMYTDTPFVRDWYEVYAGGSVRFAMDYDVYMENFNEYILGNIDLETAITEMERKRKMYLGE